MFVGFQSKICVQVATITIPCVQQAKFPIITYDALPHARESKTGFRTPRRGFRIPSTGFWILDSLSVEPGSQIPIVSGILDSFCWISHSRAQDSWFYKQKSPDSGFLEQKVSPFPSYTVQNASENDRKTDKACEAGSWLSTNEMCQHKELFS